ncbi:MAG: hypothetical protein HYY45_13660 [Deltaproteobacteria bacterium]|nr:hypothetical protein [Deltaproteobacteria bacterium]
MGQGGKYFAIAADQRPTTGQTLKEVPAESRWWTGVVVDSIMGFSATLVFVLGGVLMLRKWVKQRGPLK